MSDTYQSHLMFLIIGVIVLLTVYVNWRKQHPDAPFDPAQLHHYYRLALNLIHKNRWLILLPVSFFAINFLLVLPFEIHAMTRYGEKYQWYQSGRLISPLWSPSTFPETAWRAVGPSIHSAFPKMNEAYYGVFGGYVGLVLFMAAAILYKLVIDMFKKELDGRNAEELKLFQIVLMSGMVVAPICWVFGWVISRGTDSTGGRTILGTLSFTISSGFILSTISMLEALTLSGVACVVGKKPITSSDITKEGVTAFKTLYQFNLIILGISPLLSLLSFHKLILPRTHSINLNWWTWNLLEPAIPCLTLCFPFFIVFRRQELRVALRSTFQFILRQLPNYALFLASGVLLLFVPEFLRPIISHVLNPDHFISTDIGLIMGALRVCLATWFAVALVAWFQDEA